MGFKKFVTSNTVFYILTILIVLTFYCFYHLSEFVLDDIIKNLSISGITIITINPLESIYTKFYISSIFTLSVYVPILIFVIYMYISPGLYKKEKRIFKKVIIPMSFILSMGFVFGSVFLSQQLNYFIISQSVLNNNTTISLSSYTSFIFSIGAFIGILLCYPFVVYTLNELNLISVKKITKYRKHCIAIAFVVGALLTPPDIITQLCVAIPLIILNEFSIVVIKVKDGMVWKKKQLILEKEIV